MNKYQEANTRDALMEMNTCLGTINVLMKAKDNPTLPERAILWYRYAIEDVIDLYIETATDLYADIEYDNLHYDFEEMLLDTGRYTKETVGNVSDGWWEYLDQQFAETFWYDINQPTEKKITWIVEFKDALVSLLKTKWLILPNSSPVQEQVDQK